MDGCKIQMTQSRPPSSRKIIYEALADFDYREYLARQDVYSIMSRPRVAVLAHNQGFAPLGWLYAFKARATNVIAQILPEPQASLLTGILLGDDSGIPKSVQDAFRTTGTSHVIAISG
jgi:competence protein ComEC